MKAVEFETKIQNGIIKIPVQYEEFINKYAKIILISKDDELDSIESKNKIKLLLDQIIEKQPFSSIEDPVEWQKKLRNEWE